MFSYDPTSAVGQVRMLIGDKTEKSATFSDEEIQAVLDTEVTVTRAGVKLLRAWAAIVAHRPDQVQYGTWTGKYTSVMANMLALANALSISTGGFEGEDVFAVAQPEYVDPDRAQFGGNIYDNLIPV